MIDIHQFELINLSKHFSSKRWFGESRAHRSINSPLAKMRILVTAKDFHLSKKAFIFIYLVSFNFSFVYSK